MRRAGFLCLLLLSSCSRYDDFRLPPQPGPEGKVNLSWSVHPEPVLTRGALGDWDHVDALNPSVARTPKNLLNIYSGYDGKTWHTGVATSQDGIKWQKLGQIFSPDPQTWEGDYIAANGATLMWKGEIWHWYQGGRTPQIGLARSSDGQTWTKHGSPVMTTGPRGSWDEKGVADPYVVTYGDRLYMYYLGQDRARRQRLGLAVSNDGVNWTKLLANPILEPGRPGSFDERGLGEPAVWTALGWYWMLWTGRDRNENRRLGLAQSRDGASWRRIGAGAVLEGSFPWNAKVVCDPAVVDNNSATIRVWFGGGNRSEPAENLNGQIGLAALTLSLAE